MAIALLVYWRTAEATNALKNCAALIPEGSDRSSEGDRSNIELWEGRVDHWYGWATGVGAVRREGEVVVAFLGGIGGTNAHACAGSM